MSNAELIAELKRRANFPKDVPERAFLVGIRHLLSSAADALEEADRKLDAIQDLVPVGIAEHDTMYDALMAINKVFWSNA